MNIIFANLENNETSDAYRLRPNLTHKIYLRGSYNCVVFSNLSINKWKNIKKSRTEAINLK